MIKYKEYINEISIKDMGLSAEEKKAVNAWKKHMKDCVSYKEEKFVEAIPAIHNGKSCVVVYQYQAGTTNDAGFDAYENTYMQDEVKLSREPEYEERSEKRVKGASSFAQVKSVRIRATVLYLKTSANKSLVIDFLTANNIDFNESSDDIGGHVDDNKSELESFTKKFKNLKLEFGGYYADVDNKHFVPTYSIKIK